MPETIAKVVDARVPETVQSDVLLIRASRTGVWGTLTYVASFLGSVVLGPSSVLWALGGAGAALGGVGVVVAGVQMLRRSDVRLQWKIAGALGAPFGASLATYGLFRLLWRPLSAAAAFNPPLLYRMALYGMLILGPVLALLVGMDVVRFLVRGMMGGQEAEEPDSEGGP